MRSGSAGRPALRRRPVFRRVTLLAVLGLLAGLLGAVQVARPSQAAASAVLLSQNQPAAASSTESAAYPASAAVDGNPGTRWSSAFSDPQWLEVDLGTVSTISQVVLQWETAYATAFQIQTSNDASTWTTIYSTTTGTGGTQTLNVSGSGRYVRMYGTARATQYGYSLWEFQVYGGSSAESTCGTADAALNQPTTASSTQDATDFPASAATDGNTGTRWSSAFSDPQWLEVDLGSSQQICGVSLDWETAYGTAFQIQVSTDNTTWTTIYSTTTGTGGTQALTVSGSGRYIRMYGTARATQWGYSLWEFDVYVISSAPTGPGGGNGSGGDGVCPWVGSTAPVEQRAQQVLDNMTQAQELTMVSGNGASSPYIGDQSGIASLCIPAMGYQDGPSGVGDGLGGVTQFPDAEATAATFDTALAEQQGAAIGAEFAGKGANVDLGPTVNVVRDPRWGRAFEAYGEDPYLSGQIGAADIEGVQSQGVMAMVKHASVYTQETNRNSGQDDAVVSQQAIQEIYQPPFQTAIDQGGAASVMCAYSSINGTYACQNPDILLDGLDEQANFGGFIASDWGATHSTVPSVQAGLDMEMPGGYFYASFLSQAIASGQVSQSELNEMVYRVLIEMFSFGLFDKPASGSTSATVTTTAHQSTAEQVAAEGTVLLKNNGVLPLNPNGTESIAVIGTDAGAGVQSIGGGSATVTSSGTVWPITGIQNAAGSGVKVTYSPGDDNGTADIAAAVTAAKAATVAVVFASYGEQEGTDLTSIDLSSTDNTMIEDVAAANPNTVVVLNTGSAVTMPWLGQVAGVFDGFYSGQEVGTAIASLLFGTADPSGKLPVTFPTGLSQVPASTTAEWPGTGGQVDYNEGVDVGYRWYQSQNLTPLYPFGYGLSYTAFSFSNLQVGAFNAGGTATVTATVTNTGSRVGAEVAQLYVGDPAGNGEPPEQLKGFARVSLNAGQSATVSFPLTVHDLATWSDASNAWTAPAGAYRISVGDSSANLPLSGTTSLAQTLTGQVAAGTAGAGTSAANTAVSQNVTANSAQPGAATVGVVNPWGMSSATGAAVNFTVQAVDSNTGQALTFSATGLPAGITISASGVVSGSATTKGSSTVTVTAKDGNGVSGTATFVWTVT
jgi:beta-glucosidase